MGVLACDRAGCENIMCDICIPELGYICWECKNEFVDRYVVLSDEDCIEQLRIFMRTHKPDEHTANSGFDIEQFFNNYIR